MCAFLVYMLLIARRQKSWRERMLSIESIDSRDTDRVIPPPLPPFFFLVGPFLRSCFGLRLSVLGADRWACVCDLVGNFDVENEGGGPVYVNAKVAC